MDIQQIIGLKIRAIRKQRGLSQARLAELIDRSTEAISNLERGVSSPSVKTLINLSSQLDVPIGFFVEADASDDIVTRRMEKLAELQSIAYSLSDRELDLAVNQIRAFGKGD